MLLVQERFEEFTTKAVCDATTHTEAILALTADSRADVDAVADTALAAGGLPANEPMDMEFMYGRSFYDPDGQCGRSFIWTQAHSRSSRVIVCDDRLGGQRHLVRSFTGRRGVAQLG